MRRVHYDVTDSTNAQARRLAEAHPGDMLLVTAGEQTMGRGRQGRAWQSPRGGAWMSVAWPLRKAASEYAAASLVAAVAVTRALEEVAPECVDDLQIKWPNDVLLAGRKVAGILCELCPGGGRPYGTLILGVGINVSFGPEQLQGSLRHPATTLQAAVGRAPAVDDVIAAVASGLADAMAAFESEGLSPSLLAELRSRLAYVGTVRTWTAAGGEVTGWVRGVDAAGRLLLEGELGEVACHAGELLADVPLASLEGAE
jgi:BirA family biotin operon repressor/biotin-[acetyl-CoA-carboxylase] ligase